MNLRAHENPFRASRIEALAYRSPGCSAETLLDRLDRCGGRGALVGPKGSGKTTLLERLAEVLRERGHAPQLVRLSEACRRLDWRAMRGQSPDPATPLLVDGAEQLGRLAWWRLRWRARYAPYFVVTTHRPGRLPVLNRHATRPELLVELVGELLHGNVSTQSRPTVAELHALHGRHGGDLRLCFRELYDRYAGCGDGQSHQGVGGIGSSRTLSNQ